MITNRLLTALCIFFLFQEVFSESIQWSEKSEGEFILGQELSMYKSPDSLEWKSPEGKKYRIKWGTGSFSLYIESKKVSSGTGSISSYMGGHSIRYTNFRGWRVWEILLVLPTNGDPPNDYIYIAERDNKKFIFGARGRGLLGLKTAGEKLHLYLLKEDPNGSSLFIIRHWEMQDSITQNQFWFFGLDAGDGLITGNTRCEAFQKAYRLYARPIISFSDLHITVGESKAEKVKLDSYLRDAVLDDWTKKISHYWSDTYCHYNWSWSNEWFENRTPRKIIPKTQVLQDNLILIGDSQTKTLLQYNGREIYESEKYIPWDDELKKLFSEKEMRVVIGQDKSGIKIISILLTPEVRLKIYRNKSGQVFASKERVKKVLNCSGKK